MEKLRIFGFFACLTQLVLMGLRLVVDNHFLRGYQAVLTITIMVVLVVSCRPIRPIE